MSDFVRNELEYKEIREFFWTDSQAVLGYVNNDAKRFHVYVANRVQQIRDLTDPSSWYYVESHSNPADDVSRGLTTRQLLEGSRWLSGPEFLWESGACNPERGKVSLLLEADPEVKKASVLTTEVKTVGSFPGHFEISRLDGVSSWERRSNIKRYGVLFTCKRSKSVHLKTANSLDSSSFINALSRFMNRRDAVRQLRGDQGTNFIGARNELKTALSEMSQDDVQEYLLSNKCEWIPFKFNAPHCSHMGGPWERLIRTVRNALEPLLMKVGNQLDDETLRTFLTEVECIVNSRPLSVDYLSDAQAPEPLTPNHLLTMKPKRVLPPPGEFQRPDVYSRRRWRRVQFCANELWLRWRTEYLQMLQVRHKWVRLKKTSPLVTK
ncbi:uncharacterized protein [Montipora capricornis]|uniref:uncharacterized protein n=1 Tax=Montipora capricornis TaxID=246305 RepID=UPI0035F219B5